MQTHKCKQPVVKRREFVNQNPSLQAAATFSARLWISQSFGKVRLKRYTAEIVEIVLVLAHERRITFLSSVGILSLYNSTTGALGIIEGYPSIQSSSPLPLCDPKTRKPYDHDKYFIYICIDMIAIFLQSCLSSEAACGVATCISDGISIHSLEIFVQITAVVHEGRGIATVV